MKTLLKNLKSLLIRSDSKSKQQSSSEPVPPTSTPIESTQQAIVEESETESLSITPTPVESIDPAIAEKIHYGKAVIRHGALPTDFSINLGVAPCNHSCLFCPQSVEKPKKIELLDLELLRKVLEEIPEENLRLNISSYSETITVPNLVPAVKLMKTVRPKLPVIMATNGSIFRERVIEELIDAGLDHYSYSFDAANRDDYKTLMQVDDYEKVWHNLERIVEMRNQKNSLMKITTHIMHFKGVEEDFAKFKEYWQDKLDGVVLRPVSNWGSDELKLMQQLEDKGFVAAHETPKERFPCTSIFMHFKLQYDGLYYPCVAAVPAYDKHLVPPLGHARDITWTEAWNRLSEMRRVHLEGRWDNYECCKTCNVWSMWQNMWFQDTYDDGTKSPFYLKEIEYAQ
jgi:pyruvate-formate lyase-activating enzyme